MNVVDRFAQLVTGRDESVPLDEASLLVAAAVEPGIDIGREMRRLDELAGRVPAASVPDVVHQLFRVEGFDGDHHNYYDPANSLLPRVLDRRVGIPITLSIVAIEVGRRAGVDLAGVGLPGHFLLGDPNDRETFVDPFSGGIVLDRAACRRLFHHLHGDEASWTESYLDAVGTRAILARMLANLRQIFRSQGSRQPPGRGAAPAGGDSRRGGVGTGRAGRGAGRHRAVRRGRRRARRGRRAGAERGGDPLAPGRREPPGPVELTGAEAGLDRRVK